MVLKKRNTIFKIIEFLIIIIFTIFIIESLTRIFFFIVLKESNFIKYGFDNDLEIHTLDLSKLEISIFNRNEINLKDKKKINKKNKKIENRIVVWTFGGSTTKGNNCGKDSSSWPIQLESQNNKIVIKNFAENGYSTDKSIPLLWKNLKNETPNIIIWAHKFNISKATMGLKRNKHLIDHEFKNQNKNKTKLIVKTIDKTIKEKLLFYYFFDQLIIRINQKYNIFKPSKKQNIEKKDWEIAVKNYEINTLEAIKLSEQKLVDEFYLVSLFSEKEISTKKNYFNLLYERVLKNLSTNSFAKVIYLSPKLNKDLINNYFCDGLHKTFSGNFDTAKKINNYLINNSKFFIK